MTTGTFSVGRDAQVVLIAPNGTRVDLTGITDYRWTPQYKDVNSSPMNGPTIRRSLPDGHNLVFSIDRNGSANEALFSQIEAGWWSTGSADNGTSATGSAFIYISEPDGSTTTHQFTGVSLKLQAGGDFRSEQAVKQTIDGHAQRWSKV